MGFATNERLAADETFSPPRSRNSFLAFCKRSPFPEQNKGLSKKSAARIFLNKNIMQKIISAETLCRFKLKRQRSIVCRFLQLTCTGRLTNFITFWQRTLIYFLRGSIAVQLTICLFFVFSLCCFRKRFTCWVEFKPAKQVVSCTV